VREALVISRLDQVFRIFDDRAEALDSEE